MTAKPRPTRPQQQEYLKTNANLFEPTLLQAFHPQKVQIVTTRLQKNHETTMSLLIAPANEGHHKPPPKLHLIQPLNAFRHLRNTFHI